MRCTTTVDARELDNQVGGAAAAAAAEIEISGIRLGPFVTTPIDGRLADVLCSALN